MSVVSLNKWKTEHPDEVIVVVYNYSTVKIMSRDYRTMYKCVTAKREVTQREFDIFLDEFKSTHPAARIVDIIKHT